MSNKAYTRAAFVGLSAAVLALGLECTPRKAEAPAPAAVRPVKPALLDWPELAARVWGAAPNEEAKAKVDYVWWEAENAVSSSFPKQNPFAPANKDEAEVLSGGAWIGAENPGKLLHAEYEVDVPQKRGYGLYARKFWKHGPFRWRFNDSPYVNVGADVNLLDEQGLRKFVVANWIYLGHVELDKGKHRFRIELLEEKGASSFDAFVLTDRMFMPRGKLKPGEKWKRAKEGYFAFEPDVDGFGDSPIDLRGLNESTAGEGGFIVARGENLVHEKTGQPLRLWAVNVGYDMLFSSDRDIDYFARRLAKVGVNMVRVHGGVWDDEKISEISRRKLERLHYFVAAMKKEGVYVNLSIYFPLWMNLDEKKHGFKGYKGEHPFALPYFSEQFQTMYRGWWKQLLTAKNPHTGVPLVEDPAVAMVELVNEDGTMFWTFDTTKIPAAQVEMFERKFADWLAAKHGSADKALAAWGGARQPRDLPQKQRIAFVPLWEIFSKKDRRGQDTAEFLTKIQYDFYSKMVSYLKKDLGYRASTVCSNWITANSEILGPLDKYSNTVCDVMDRHGYFEGPHEGDAASYSVAPGQKYDDAAAVLFESSNKHKEDAKPSYSLPIMDIAYNGAPSILSEVNWPPPNRFRADFPVLAAAYGALQGSDGQFFFATAAPAWAGTVTKFTISDPVIMGQFPATARIFREQLIEPAPAVADIKLAIGDLYALKGAPVQAPTNLDLFRQKDVPPGGTAEVEQIGSLDPLAFLVGRVEMHFTEAAGASKIMNLAEHIDRDASRVQSITRELSWDYKNGLVTLNGARAQGATGFLGSMRPLDLRDVRLDIGVEYGSVLLVPLDGKPLAESRKMLLQVMTENQNYGFAAEPAQGMREIKSVGEQPIVVRSLAGGILLKRADVGELRVTALDFDGYPVRQAASVAEGIPLLPDVLYYVIEKP
jgi:hypothetical protein